VASLAVAGVGLIFSVAPCLAYVGMGAGVVGLILGLVGLVIGFAHQRRGLGLPLAGTLVSLLPIVICVIWVAWVGWTVRSFFGGVEKNVDNFVDLAKKEQEKFAKEQDRIKKEQQYQFSGHPEVIKNLRQLGGALSGYHDNHGHFPAAGGATGKLSWRVHILPLLGEDALYKQFKLDEPWDSPTNSALLAKMPKIYAPVRQDGSVPDGWTFYQVFTKPGGAFPLDGKGPTLAKIANQDGTAKTFLLAEAGHPVPWTKPADVAFDPKGAIPKLGHAVSTGFHGVMFDGNVYFINNSTSQENIRRWIIPDDGRDVPLP